jgi:hypothetical protein
MRIAPLAPDRSCGRLATMMAPLLLEHSFVVTALIYDWCDAKLSTAPRHSYLRPDFQQI